MQGNAGTFPNEQAPEGAGEAKGNTHLWIPASSSPFQNTHLQIPVHNAPSTNLHWHVIDWRETHLPDLVLRPSLLSSSPPPHPLTLFPASMVFIIIKRMFFLRQKTQYSRPSDNSLQPKKTPN